MSTTLTIRNLDDTVKQKLRLRAARHQTSMEAEARAILALRTWRRKAAPVASRTRNPAARRREGGIPNPEVSGITGEGGVRAAAGGEAGSVAAFRGDRSGFGASAMAGASAATSCGSGAIVFSSSRMSETSPVSHRTPGYSSTELLSLPPRFATGRSPTKVKTRRSGPTAGGTPDLPPEPPGRR